MEEHLRYAAIGRYAYDGLKLILVLFLASFFGSFGAWQQLNSNNLWGLLSQFLLALVVFVGLQSVLGLVAAHGMLQRLPWGRTLGMVVNLLDLVVFPIGTILGGYSLWVLFQPQTEQLFRERSASALP